MTENRNIHEMIDKSQIEATVKKLAAEIEKDYQNKNPLIIGILKGSFVFLSDLVRFLPFDLEIDFVRVASYGNSTCSSCEPKLLAETVTDVKGRHIILVEDIVDTGITTSFVCDYLKDKEAASVKLCSLLNKPSRRRVEITIDYEGLSVPDKFIVGYGLDCAEKYRNLPAIYSLDEEC